MEGGGGGECKTLINNSFYLLYVLSYSHVLIFPSIILTVKLSSQYSLSEERETGTLVDIVYSHHGQEARISFRSDLAIVEVSF